MVLSPKLLGADERVAIHTRTHPKRLILPAVTLVVLCVALGVGVALIPDGARPIGQLAVALVGLVLAIWLVVLPFLRWWTTTSTVTNRRLLTRSGILNKVGKDIPLMRINDVLYERSLIDRMLGSGTLFIQTAAEGGTIKLDDVPHVEQLQLEMSELLFGTTPTAGRVGGPDQHRHGGS
ncbi:MAG TPA: PH domain-containing protein [Propionibacteriaceae bacterium]|nr:PH domain-containing protein [Propionibacteriaceae bacterium]